MNSLHLRSGFLIGGLLLTTLSSLVLGGTATKDHADATRGRALFNGKGVCASCHGADGDLSRRPRVNEETGSVITRLNPPPSDLRNPRALRLKTDKERFRIIREGHPGTGMLPDPSLGDQEIADLIAYLAQLRRDVSKGDDRGGRP